METITYILPSYLAPYLINGDASGLDDKDLQEIEQWLDLQQETEGSINIVDCGEESYFSKYNDLHGFLGCDVLEYTALVRA